MSLERGGVLAPRQSSPATWVAQLLLALCLCSCAAPTYLAETYARHGELLLSNDTRATVTVRFELRRPEYEIAKLWGFGDVTHFWQLTLKQSGLAIEWTGTREPTLIAELSGAVYLVTHAESVSGLSFWFYRYAQNGWIEVAAGDFPKQLAVANLRRGGSLSKKPATSSSTPDAILIEDTNVASAGFARSHTAHLWWHLGGNPPKLGAIEHTYLERFKAEYLALRPR